MDKYKIVKSQGGNYVVFTRDYFWQKWHRVCDRIGGEPIVADTLENALRAIGSPWWKDFTIRVDSIGVF